MAAESARSIGGPLARFALRLYVGLAAIFLLAPIVAITAGSLTTTQFVVFPPQGLTLRWYLRMFDREEMLTSFGLSLGIAAAAATVASLLGLLAGLALARYRTPLNRLLWLLVASPMMLPAVVLGFAFLQAYTRMGFGTTPLGLLAGHVVLVAPYALALIVTGLGAIDPNLEAAARSLGASPRRALVRITLPLMLWSLAAGWGLAFLVSFGDAAVSVFLNTPEMVTLPVRIFDALRYSPLNPELTALSSGLVIVTLAVLVASASMVRLDRIFGGALRAPGPGKDGARGG
jgi:putative spermidine/putrescine transport system permease protein